jgi:hypothetical protein
MNTAVTPYLASNLIAEFQHYRSGQTIDEFRVGEELRRTILPIGQYKSRVGVYGIPR